MEEVHLLVQEEGRAAHHAAFSVPVSGPPSPQPDTDKSKTTAKKPPTNPRLDINKREEVLSRTKRTSESGAQGSRTRSASAGRDKKTESEHVHWSFLQTSLMRVMEDIFDSCEKSESVDKCKVITLMLENYMRDFKGLSQYFNVKWKYENTPLPERPTSLAWEVRRTSPSKFFLALKALRHSGNPEEMRACLVNYLAQELSLTRVFGLSAADIAKAASESAGLLPIKLNLDEPVQPNQISSEIPLSQVNSCELQNSTSEKDELAKPLDVSDTGLGERISSDLIPITNVLITSVSSQTEESDISKEENVDVGIQNNLEDSLLLESAPDKKEEGCQTDPIPLASYTLDLTEEGKTCKEIIPGNISPSIETLSKPKTPLRSVAPVRPTVAPTFTRGVSRPLVARGRGIVNDVRTIQPRLVRSAQEPRVGIVNRGLPRKVLETRVRPATTNGNMLPRQTSARIGQAIITLPNKPNIGVGRVDKKLPERVSKNEHQLRMLGRDNMEPEGSFGEQRSNSSSSINSSSSRSSWADKVRGNHALATTTEVHSVDDLLQHTSVATTPQEDDGWKMVKVRSRSKISPVSKLEQTLSQSSASIKIDRERKTALRPFAQSRFNQPSAARSLPTLALNVSTTDKDTATKKSSTPKILNTPLYKKVNSTSKLAIKAIKSDKSITPENQKEKNLNKTKATKTEQSYKKSPLALTNGEVSSTEKIQDSVSCTTEDADKKEGNLSEKGDSDREEEEQQRKFDDEVRRKTEELCEEEARLERQIKELETEVDLETDDADNDMDGESDLELGEKLHAQYILQELGQPGRALELHQKLSSPSRRRNLADSVRCFQAKQAKAQEIRAKLMQDKWYKLQELSRKIEEVRAAQTQNTELKREQLELKLKRAEEKRNKHLQEIARKAHDEEEKLKEIAFINELEAQNKRHDFMALCQEQEERLQGIQEERQRKQEEKAAKEAAVEERKKILAAERQAKLDEMQERRRRREERIGREFQEKEKERLELAKEKARDRDQRLQALQAAQLATQEELQKKIQAKQEEYARRHEENMEQIRQRALECCFLRTDVAPRLAPYDTHKLCTLCNVLIGSDVYLVSHLRGRQHQEAVKAQLGGKDVTREELEIFSLRHITDAPASNTDRKLALDRERQKALKKRCKKIRLRMAAKGEEYESKFMITTKSDSSSRLEKCVKEVERLLTSQGRGLWGDQAITSVERSLAEIGRILDKKKCHEQDQFVALGGFKILSELLGIAMEGCPGGQLFLPTKCFVTVCNAYTLACNGNTDICCHVILSNKISTIMDLLLHRLTSSMPTRGRGGGGSSMSGTSGTAAALPVDNLAGALMRLLAMLLEVAVQNSLGSDAQQQQLSPRVQDVVSYAVSAGILEKLAAYCGAVRDPIDEDQPGALFLLAALRLLRALVACARAGGNSAIRQDVSQLGATLRVTELVGGVSMLYGMLLHQGAPPRGSGTAPPPLPPHIVHVARATLRLLLEVAEMDLALFQGVLGAEGMSLQFRHLSSYLLWAFSGGPELNDELLQDVIRLVGFFAVRNHDNQMTIQSGFTPTVLQQLCTLPFEYFMEERRTRVLFPTLLACCWDNSETRAVLEQEISFQILEDFRVSEVGQQDSLVALLQTQNPSPI